LIIQISRVAERCLLLRLKTITTPHQVLSTDKDDYKNCQSNGDSGQVETVIEDEILEVPYRSHSRLKSTKSGKRPDHSEIEHMHRHEVSNDYD